MNNTSLSIIIPTYHEADNIPTLIKRIASLPLYNRIFEVILVDDNSQDGTEDVVIALQKEYAWLKLITRKNNRGLSQSILEGFKAANYSFLIMMDADLSHPPEKIIDIITQLERQEIDMVIGSRYITGGSIEEKWPLHRKIISKLCAFSARSVLSMKIYDPLSGFVAIKKEKYLADKIDPIGWKIGLEMMVKCPCHHLIEIPINFAERQAGKSKLNATVALKYLIQLKRLFFYKYLNK